MQATKEQIRNLGILKKRAEFLAMNKKGRKWVSHGLILQVLPNDLDQIRMGFTVSKKVHKSAVKRNRIKRRLRAAASDVLPVVAAPGHDYVLIGRPLTATRPYQSLVGDLKWCLEKLGCMRQEENHDE